MAPDLHDKIQKSRHIVLSFEGARRESGLGAAAWIRIRHFLRKSPVVDAC